MRIITNNKCSECCYCIDDYDGFGLCCKDNLYKNISINQNACRFFCGDNDDITYYNNPISNNDDEEEEVDFPDIDDYNDDF